MRRLLLATGSATFALGVTAAPALACAGLVGENGSVQLERTSTLAAYVDGVEHYVTSFEFSGGGAEVGSIIPLPGVPTDVVKGGAWTLQRLQREVEPPPAVQASESADAAQAGGAEVLLETRIDALELTVLRGGGDEVGEWAIDHGFRLTPDAPEVLDFYSERSPIFLAARFDATAAVERGQGIGDGTPVHLTIPTDDPWVPLRILGLGRAPEERVEADVFLLTERRPAILSGDRSGALDLSTSEAASTLLLDDLRSDEGMEWVPASMWLSHLTVDTDAGDLDYDLAVDASRWRQPEARDAGVAPVVAGLERLVVPGPALGPIVVSALGGVILGGLAVRMRRR
jgi:hypothetical protein